MIQLCTFAWNGSSSDLGMAYLSSHGIFQEFPFPLCQTLPSSFSIIY